jgi:2-keto-4-pentenoate hydratase
VNIAKVLAEELQAAYRAGRQIPPPSSVAGLDLATAYATEAELAHFRRAEGHRPVGRKVGFANKAMWRILKLDTLVWAHMYDDTVRHATADQASLSLAGRIAPRIEPEIVFKLARPLPAGTIDAAAALAHVEWLALGFEVNDCIFPDWKFQPADFVAAYGLHMALMIGTPQPVTTNTISALVEQLPRFTVRLMKNGELVEEGSGKNSLRSPALCLCELATVVSGEWHQEPLDAGEIISTGTLTGAHPIAAGETWRAEVSGIDLPPLTLRLD